jgi:Tol biopolymer transport system component
MTEPRTLIERSIRQVDPPSLTLESFHRRLHRHRQNRRLAVGAFAMVVAIAGLALAMMAFRQEHTTIPAGTFDNGIIVVRDGGRLIGIGPGGQEPIRSIDDALLTGACPADARCIAETPYVWSADGAILAFVAGPYAGPHSIYTIGPSGEPRLIASCDPRCADMAWSPNGHRLSFAAGNAITVVDVDTGQQTQIRLAPCANHCVISPPDPLRLAWSPDGSQIASVSDYHTITVSAADGSAASMLVEPGSGDPVPADLAWSSDASIVFSTRRTSSEEIEGIWSLSVDTGATANLLDVGLRPSIHGLLVAPDGSLVWMQTDGAGGPCPGCPFTGSIWTAESGGSNPRILYDAGCCTESNTNDAFTGPVLSPDGTKLVFTLIHGSDRATDSGVYVMNRDGTGVRRIATTGAEPAWQPIPKGSS